ncbi:MAG: GNAT family N-acetyltransferase [Desulfurococcales archaeon ex4484_58]|nr:MAG: GNAT family N-acetyltransferase [Desulfurococcales archaeon ex4484_58]
MVKNYMELEIKHTSRVIYTVLPDNSKAFIRYRIVDHVMELLETYTPPQHRGRGIARKLMDYAIKLAQENNWLIKPICSYSIYYFIKNKEKRKLLTPEFKNMSDDKLKKIFEERLHEEQQKQT